MNITYIIIGITALTSFYAFNRPDIMARYMMNPYLVRTRGQYYRFISSGFIHGNMAHLFLNLFSFYFFGGVVEQIFGALYGPSGSAYYVAFYLLSIVAADIPSYLKHMDKPHYNSLGASGGVSALIFVSIVFMPLQDICIYFAFCLPGFILGAGYLIYSYFKGRNSDDHINHDAHLYGALFGLLYCAVMVPRSIPHFFDQVSQWRLF